MQLVIRPVSDIPPKPIKSISELARRFHRSRSVVRRWMERPNWPVGPRPPWSGGDVDAIRSFVAMLRPARQPGEQGPSTTATLELKQERAKLVKLQRQILAKKFHDAKACERRIVALIRYTVSTLSAWAESLPDELDSIHRQLWGEHIRKRLDETLTRISNVNQPDRDTMTLDEAGELLVGSDAV